MAKSGDVIENPLTGERFIVTKSAAETNGELLEGVLVFAPRAAGPMPHVHSIIEERVKVVAGTLKVKIDGEERTLHEGEEAIIKPGSPHALWNDSDEEIRFEVLATPALKLETFIETLFGLARDGKTNKKGMPSPLQAAVLIQEYSDEMQLADVPLFAQRLLATLVAPIGRLFGYKGRYPEYSGE
jgi:quercetin dioxygenase-like cupin family protein